MTIDEKELPKDWTICPFSDAVLKGRPKVGKVQRTQYKLEGRYPIVDQGQQFIAGWWDDEHDVYTGPFPLIVFGDHTRTFKYVDFPFVAGADGTQLLSPNIKNFDPLFLYFAFLSLSIPNRGYNRHFSLLKESAIPRPTPQEQKAIAKALKTVQSAVQASHAVLESAIQLREILLDYSFQFGPVPFSSTHAIERSDDGHPAHWQKKDLKLIANVRGSTSTLERIDEDSSGATHGDLEKVLYLKVSDLNLPANYRWVRVAAIERSISGERLDGMSYVTPGAIVLPKRGAAIATNKKRQTAYPSLLDPNLIAVEPKEGIDPDYLFAWFQKLDLRSITDDGTLPQLNKKDLEPLKVAVPPDPAEQAGIGKMLIAIDEKIAKQKAHYQATDGIFRLLISKLIWGELRLPGQDQ